jgi:DNA-binding transcriptional ArsR family regulator
MDMSRQAVTQHLGVLEAANLISTIKRGREKLHFLNPVPIHEIYDRWVQKFERRGLRALDQLKKQLEGRLDD